MPELYDDSIPQNRHREISSQYRRVYRKNNLDIGEATNGHKFILVNNKKLIQFMLGFYFVALISVPFLGAKLVGDIVCVTLILVMLFLGPKPRDNSNNIKKPYNKNKF